jgi:hypothetical protein
MTDQLPNSPGEPTAVWSAEVPTSPGASTTSGSVVAAGVILLVIATLVGIFGIFAVFAGSIMGDLKNFPGQSGLTQEQLDTVGRIGRTVIIAFGGVALAIALGHLLSGIGVLRRRGWARILGLVMSVLGVLFWLLLLVSSVLAATQAVPAGYLENSGLTVEEYRSIARAGWIFGMAFSGVGLAGYLFVLVVLIRKGREFA